MNKISYYRFCCRIRIADEYAEEVPGGEFLAIEVGDIRERHERFAESRLSEFSDWFSETPALLAHVRALQTGRTRSVEDIRTRLVDTETACKFTDRTRQDLFILAKRGKLTKYPTRRGHRTRVMWDPLELDTVKRR